MKQYGEAHPAAGYVAYMSLYYGVSPLKFTQLFYSEDASEQEALLDELAAEMFANLPADEKDGITEADVKEELRDMIGANAEGDEEAQKGLIQQLEELRELIGANAEGDEEAKKGVLQQLEELRELIGANAEGDEEARGGIIKDITNLQNLVGTPARGEDPATGLHREIENLQESIEEVKDEYLKFWVGTNAEYQALTRVEHGRLYIIID
jgi:hypothetical protein